jgi:low affinity Fe/Cu permease
VRGGRHERVLPQVLGAGLERRGTPAAFAVALLIIVVWLVTGPIFHFSDTWQLIINTGTTIVTFLMVFLLQNTQNRESRATQIKLDELLRAVTQARTSLVDLEDLPDEQLDALEEQFRTLSANATRSRRRERRNAAGETNKGRKAAENAQDTSRAQVSSARSQKRG